LLQRRWAPAAMMPPAVALALALALAPAAAAAAAAAARAVQAVRVAKLAASRALCGTKTRSSWVWRRTAP
jgi:hypothetical protein